MTPLSLYLHIPFCAKKCRYCDFYSTKTDERLIERYCAALPREIDLYRAYPAVTGAQVRTVFFGGGTPTVLAAEDLAELCGLVRSHFSLAPDVEWTVECNPESVTREKAAVLHEQGVTRLTFGIQSLNDRELSLLGRVHASARAMEVLRDPVLNRFQSIGADIIYGIPGQTVETLDRTIDALTALPVIRHISAYELNVAEGTPMGRHRSLLPMPVDESVAAMTQHLWKCLADAGFEQYEVSNFAKQGHRCCHNEAYWDHQPYLGLGCAAHSYLHPQRWGNVRDVSRYCTVVETGVLPREFTETLDPRKLAMEMVFLGLRRADGIDEERFKVICGNSFEKIVDGKKLEYYRQQGLIRYDKPFWRPTPQGMLLADGMARGLVQSNKIEGR
jgi:oxygen-independent coproporphyrinogen III oxidase